MASTKHINFQANDEDMMRIEFLRTHISDTLGSRVSFAMVIRNAITIAVKHISAEQKTKKVNPFADLNESQPH